MEATILDTHSTLFQAVALANAVFAYASNADNLGVLGDAVALMAHKHVSFDILPGEATFK